MEDGFELGCVHGCIDHTSGGKCAQGICAGHTFPQTFSTLSLTVPNPGCFWDLGLETFPPSRYWGLERADLYSSSGLGTTVRL